MHSLIHNQKAEDRMMPQGWGEWKKLTTAVPWTRGMTALPPCCYCRRPAKETEVSFWEIPSDTPIDEIGYCMPYPKIRCAPDKGCNAEPWSRQGMHLREGRWDGPAPFIRKSDNTRWNFSE